MEYFILINYSYLFCGFIIGSFGLIGNTLVIVSILKSKELRKNPAVLLCLNLSICDFISSLLLNTFEKLCKYFLLNSII